MLFSSYIFEITFITGRKHIPIPTSGNPIVADLTDPIKYKPTKKHIANPNLGDRSADFRPVRYVPVISR